MCKNKIHDHRHLKGTRLAPHGLMCKDVTPDIVRRTQNQGFFMTAIPTSAPVVPGRLEPMSTRVAFFIAGFGIAALAPLVPYAQARAALGDEM